MNCIDFRRQIGTEPNARSDELTAHREGCHTCATYALQMQSLDGALQSAVNVDVPAGLVDNILRNASAGAPVANRSWYALAASLLVGLGLAAGLWLGGGNTDAIASELVAHVEHESDLLLLTGPSLPVTQVNNVIHDSQVSLNGDISGIRYAGLCSFRGKLVSHLVVKGEAGPVTVMLLPDEHVAKTRPFDEEGYRGMLVPVGKGSIAIIGNPEETLESVREQFARSVEFSI